MRLVKIKLRDPNTFWILNPVHLKKGEETSPLINADALSAKQVDIINQSIGLKQIGLVDQEGKFIDGNLGDVNVFDGSYVSSDDIPEDKDLLPEIISITVPMEAQQDDEDSEDSEEEISEEVYEDAKILLTKNGNTVKKTLRNLPNSSDNLLFLHACLELEVAGQNREGIVLAIQKKMTEI